MESSTNIVQMDVVNPNFANEIDTLQKELSNIAKTVLNSHTLALEGFSKKSDSIFESVALTLKGIEDAGNRIDNRIVKILALYGAESKELRFLIAGIKLTNELVSVGNDAKRYAKNTKELLYLEDVNLDDYKEYITNMHKCTIKSIKYALFAIEHYYSDDSEDFFTLSKIEESKTDDLYSLLEKEILGNICKDVELSQKYIKILKSIRKLERSADRAVDICSLMHYVKYGGSIQSY
jgi:phosphate transport system protein